MNKVENRYKRIIYTLILLMMVGMYKPTKVYASLPSGYSYLVDAEQTTRNVKFEYKGNKILFIQNRGDYSLKSSDKYTHSMSTIRWGDSNSYLGKTLTVGEVKGYIISNPNQLKSNQRNQAESHINSKINEFQSKGLEEQFEFEPKEITQENYSVDIRQSFRERMWVRRESADRHTTTPSDFVRTSWGWDRNNYIERQPLESYVEGKNDSYKITDAPLRASDVERYGIYDDDRYDYLRWNDRVYTSQQVTITRNGSTEADIEIRIKNKMNWIAKQNESSPYNWFAIINPSVPQDIGSGQLSDEVLAMINSKASQSEVNSVRSSVDAVIATANNALSTAQSKWTYNEGTIRNVKVNNAASSDRLSSAKDISLGGDLNGTVSFDGSKNVSIPANLNNSTKQQLIALPQITVVSGKPFSVDITGGDMESGTINGVNINKSGNITTLSGTVTSSRTITSNNTTIRIKVIDPPSTNPAKVSF